MPFRQRVEIEVAKYTNAAITDELFREATIEADHDIKFHNFIQGKKTSHQYVIYVLVTIILILLNINNSSCKRSEPYD